MMVMQTTTGPATFAQAFDGPIDDGIERAEERSREPELPGGGEPRPSGGGDMGAEAAAHSLLRMVCDHPGSMGRLRAARIIGGYPVPYRDDEDGEQLERYAVELDWPLREITRLVDTLISGGLMTQTPGPRPVLVLTRSGFRVLEALEAGPEPG